MGSREDILAALRRNQPAESAHPDISGLGTIFADPIAELEKSAAVVGASFVRAPDLVAADAAVAALPVSLGAKKVVSLVPGVGRSTLDMADVATPQDLHDLDLAILPGDIAVAESAAVWLDGHAYHHRAVFVITNHLVLVVHAKDVVSNLHQAYARLAGRRPRYGLFVSGPSKTADIEQVLVVGAQGARTCTLVLIG